MNPSEIDLQENQSPEDVDKLKNQLKVARSEIKNLRYFTDANFAFPLNLYYFLSRHEIQSINHVYKKDVEDIRKSLQTLTIENLLLNTPETNTRDTPNQKVGAISRGSLENRSSDETDPSFIKFKPIGVIRTIFSEKRALPRQAVLAKNLLSRIELSSDLYTNPGHSLEGLEEFSHIWIIYHFHKNSTHSKAKVAPPRLDGRRIGVFSSRSPHRPNPIGLSLVELDRIEDRYIFFKGFDMVDGTPVLDIKPYIPHYDSPAFVDYQHPHLHPGTPETSIVFSKRGAPDGEETEEEGAAGGVPISFNSTAVSSAHSSPTVKVPNWIMEQTKLSVSFTDHARQQIDELGMDMATVKEILKSDPRSVYLRSRYGSDVYTFQLHDLTVTCKFDDDHGSVQVVQLRKRIDTEELSRAD